MTLQTEREGPVQPPVEAVGRAADIADGTVFLATEQARCITGQ
jgi:hypothetical protein